jgi:hypothetical protein
LSADWNQEPPETAVKKSAANLFDFLLKSAYNPLAFR